MGQQLNQSLFAMDDFRPYLKSWARARGRGEFRKIAQTLQIHTTLVSQIVNGKKCLTEEQAARLCRHMGLNALETDYFLKLVQIERAGTEELKDVYRRHLSHLKDLAKEAKSRVPESKKMSLQDRAVFYSSWQYSMIRLMTSIDRFQTVEAIAFEMDLSVSRVREILDFLVSRGLCLIDQNGRYLRTSQNTHIEARSPLAIRHHQNWRARSIDLQEKMGMDDLVFTAPVSISKKDINKVKAVLLDAISSVAKIVDESPSEEIVYFGLDWIKM